MIRPVFRIIIVVLLLMGSQVSIDAQSVQLVQVPGNVMNPVAITNAADGSERLFVTEQRGRIVIISNNTIVSTPFLEIQSLVGCCGERGLLSVAFHPQYVSNGFFFIYYTDLSGDTVVARYARSSSDPNRADPGTAVIILRVDQPFSNHNGGPLKFGPDGYLYIGLGDGGSGGDPGNRSQNLTTLLGKILRIDIDSGSPYAIPSDNPFLANTSARPEIWSYGLRNPWRFTFDRSTGDMFIGDVGQNILEEINLEPAGQGGANYGWRRMEGSRCFDPATNCNDGTLVLPILEYNHSDGCSITAGYRYRGSGYPSISGRYFYGDYCSGKIWMATQGGDGTWTSTVIIEANVQVTSFGEDEKGELYLADAGGRIFRITSNLVNRSRPARR